jgi:ubiquinone biosynthesis protein UbiJ
MVSASGTVTNMGESLNKITASGFVGVSHSGGTAVDGTWHYIIHDPTWEGAVAQGNYEDGYVDLVGKNMPKGFVTADDNKGLIWDDDKQAYNYKGKPVDYSNVYVIDGKIGVFTNKDGSDFYEGTVFGKNNEILMTVKDDNGHFYSYWASAVTDPSATMSTYRLAEYKKDLSVLVENDEKLSRNDIKEVTLDTTQANSATIGLLRNGDTEAGAPVKGAITVTSGGGTDGSGAANDTFVKISNGTVNQTFATGSKVEVNGPANAITGIKVNGVDYTIKQGSGVKVEQDAANKTTTITVDGNATTITDTDTTYTAGDGIEINGGNAISVSKNLIGMESIQGAGEGKISFDGDNVKVNNTTFGENSVVVGVAGDGKHPVRIDGETGRITGLANTKVGYTDFANDKGTAATEGQLKQVMDEGWKFTTDSNEKTTVKVGPDGTNDNAVTFKGDGTNIAVTNTGKDIKVALKKDLTVDSVKAGDFFMDKNKGVGYVDKAYITSSGLNANNQKITGVADGTNDTDAVNFGQLKKVSNNLVNVDFTNISNNGKTEIVNIAKAADVHVKDGQYSVQTDGTVTMKYVDGNGDEVTGNELKITDVASATKLNALNNTVTNIDGRVTTNSTNITTLQGEVITSGSIGANGKVELTKKDGGKVEVGTVKDYSVTSGTYDQTTKKLTLTKNDAYGNATSGTVDIDLSGIQSGDKNWTAQANGTDVKPNADNKVNFINGDNTNVTTSGDGVIAVNLNKNLTGLNSVTTNNAYVTNVDKTDNHSVTNVQYVNEQIAGVTLTAGDGISISEKKIKVKLKDGEQNLVVDSNGLALNTALTGIESITGAGAGSISFADGAIKLNNKVTIDNTGKITGVAAGTADTDAVNVSQLNKVSATAKTEVKAGTNIVSVDKTTGANGQDIYTVNAKDTTYAAGNGITISGENNAIAVNLKAGENNLEVTAAGLALKKDLNVDSVKAGEFYMSNAGFGYGDKVYITSSGMNANNQKITNVKAGEAETDAVNVSQLNNVKAEAGKHTTLVAGENVTLDKKETDKGLEYTVNAVDTKYTAGNGITIDAAANNAISVNLKEGEVNLAVDEKGLSLNKGLKGIESVSNGSAKLALSSNPIFGATAELTNGQASVNLMGGSTKINGKVEVRQDGTIGGVTDGRSDKDAVNVSQLKKVSDTANAGWNVSTNGGTATNVKPGETVDFSGDKNISVSNDGTKVKVELNKNLKDIETISNGGATLTLGAMGGMVSEFTNGQGASVKLFGDTATINGKVNVYKDGRIAGVADGVNATDAVNVSQLQKAAAASATTISDGVNTTVTATKAEDGHTDYKVNLNKDLVGIESISNGGASLTMNGFATELANGQGASVKLFGDTTTINGKVNVYKDGRIAGVADGINNNDAVNVGQLNKVSEIANKGWNLATNGVATEATNVKPGDYVDFSGDKNISVSHDGTKVKVELNKDLDVNSVQTNALNSKYNLSVGTMAENGIMPFFVNSTGAFYAASNKFSVDKDGNMNANSVQTNALNSKYNLSVGTANENGTVPFFVNSNGAFYAANGKLVVDKDGKLVAPEAELGKVTADEGVIGNVVLKDGVFYKHTALRDGELFVGDASGNYSQITTKGAKLGKVTIAEDGKISGVAAGEVSSTSTDAINGSQLHQTNENVAALDKRVTQNEADIATNKANIAQNAADIAANKANIAQNAADIATNKANIAQNKADIAQNKADIAQNKTDIKNLDNRVTNVEELAKKHTTVTAGDNITVTEDTNKDGGKEYKVALDKDIKLDSVTTGQTVMNNDGLKVGDKVSVNATAVTAGKTSISDEGVKVGDKTYISDKGLNANDQKVTNVAAGEISATSKDAVNGSQLYATNQEVANNTNRINQLGSRVNKVGAGAAALAALHPMDFDPDDKLTFSAGYGNYGGENAAAIGAYYRPDEKVMFSVGGTVGNGENMVNAGVSFSLDRTNHVSNSRTAMAREILDLRAEVTELKAMVAKGGLGSIAEDKMKIFPDVAENHWAYEYVGKLAAAGIIEGYPDGKFSGDRMMSRYEFAAMLYRAMQKGAQLDSKIINEFAPEMGRIRVDRISGEDGDRDKIERVRVNAVKGERDHYGNKIAKAEAKAK